MKKTETNYATKALDALADIDTALVIIKKAEETIEELETCVRSGYYSAEKLENELHDIRHLVWATEDITKAQLEKARQVLEDVEKSS